MPPRLPFASLLLSLLLGLPGMAGAASNPAPPADGNVVFRDYFGMKFKRPVVLAEIPGHPEHYLVVEQPGSVVLVRPVHAGGGRGWEKSSFAEVRVAGGRFFEDERGLLGLAFHPRFKENGKYYLDYVEPANGATFITERQADASRLKDAGKPERVLLEIPQPYPNHNGGTIAFGPDGFLYIGMGDGGSGGDPENRAQNPRELLGKMLRIDVNHRDADKGYGVPADNPFVGRHKYRPEIWAMGLRNPWKWTFQPETGALWAGDVGQGEREEISIIPRGGNMGWRHWEGDRCHEPGKCGASPGAGGVTAPLVSLPRAEAISVTGGEFVPSDAATAFAGAYVFGDYGKGTVWALRRKADASGWERVRIGSVPAVSAFARDAKGRVFALGLKDGVIRLLEFPAR
jgi:glucose/arabinose dehydrogenase